MRRLATDDDLGWITAARSDRELSRYIPMIPYPYSKADARAFAEHVAHSWAECSAATFVIAQALGGQGSGTIGLHLFADGPGLAEVGY